MRPRGSGKQLHFTLPYLLHVYSQQVDALTLQLEQVDNMNQEKLENSLKQLELKKDAVSKLEKQSLDLKAKAALIRKELGLPETEEVGPLMEDSPSQSLDEMKLELLQTESLRDKLIQSNNELRDRLKQ